MKFHSGIKFALERAVHMFGLRIKLLICLGSLVLILITVTFVANSVLNKYSNRIQSLFREDFDSAVACQAMKESVEAIDQQAQRRVWGDASADMASVKPYRGDFDKEFERQIRIANLPGEEAATQELGELWKKYQASMPYVFDADRSEQDRRNSYLVTLLPASRQVREKAQKIIELNMTSMVSGHGEARRMGTAARITTESLMAAGAVVAVLVVAASGTLVLRPLRQLTDSARKIASGNLDLSVAVRTHDELGRLGEAFNDMAAQLRVFKRMDQERLARTQRTTQLAIDSLPDAVVVADPNGTIELTNQTAKRMFALNPQVNVADLPTRWLADLHHQALVDSPRHGAGFEGAIRVQPQDQQEFYFLPKTFPIVDENRNLIGALIVLADVTDLRQLDDMKNKLLAMVSHELKTPLTSMRMIMHLVAEEKVGPLTEKQRDLLTAAREDSDRLHHIVENLMDMGRIESGKALMEQRPVDAALLASQAIDFNRAAFAAKGVELKLDAPDQSPLAMADSARIGHVLNNLLSNALKYTAAGGAVAVGIHESAGGWVEFSVADNGCGISRQHLSQVFEKFFRVPGQSGDTGTGLGLAIVKDIVEAHGGRIWVESSEGAGTTFRFVLPGASPMHSQMRNQLKPGQEAGHDSVKTQLA